MSLRIARLLLILILSPIAIRYKVIRIELLEYLLYGTSRKTLSRYSVGPIIDTTSYSIISALVSFLN